MKWRIIHQNECSRIYVKAERIDNKSDDQKWIYYGGMDNDLQPHGLGALYIDGEYKKGGRWEHGNLDPADRLPKDIYDTHMNEIVNKK